MMYTYSWYQWLAFFYLYCFFGWIFESVYVSLKKRSWINRGFLRIPMLPLYGSGAVMMLWVSLPVRDNLFLVYIFGVAAATVLEYVTGSMMEQLFKVRYWDYSNQRFQIHGYICLTSSIAWGFLTILMTEVIHEPVSVLVLNANQRLLLITVLFVTIVFAADVYVSTRAALALGKSLEIMTRLKADMEELQGRISSLREEAAEQLYSVKEEAAKRAAAAKSRKHTELTRLLARLEEIREKRASILSVKGFHRFYRSGLLKGNPGAISMKFSAALKELREHDK